jgi:hypothetical protein
MEISKLDKTVLDPLLNLQTDYAVTIYMPVHTTASPPHITENQIRFKNLINKAVDQLPEHGEGHSLAEQLKRQLDSLYDDLSFWEDQTPGLLICADPGKLQMFHLPIDTEEYVAVDRQFHLAPVMGLLQDAREYFLLSLAQHDPQLYKGGLYDLGPSGIELPANVKAALNIDESNQKSEHQATAAGPSTRGKASSPNSQMGWFNGRGGARNPQEEDRLRFFRMIDKIVCDSIDQRLPLVLAGIEAEIAEYRQISKYPKILQGTIAGNHTNDDPQSLFDAARDIVWRELVVPDHLSAIDEYQRLSGANPDRVAQDFETVTAAAKQGRIDKLLTRMSRQTTDTVRDIASAVPRITFPDSDQSKQINDVALTVWQTSGTVYNLQPEEMPNGGLLAARLRY